MCVILCEMCFCPTVGLFCSFITFLYIYVLLLCEYTSVYNFDILLNPDWYVFQTYLKQLIEAVRKNDVNKASRLTMKGLDPNFIDAEIGGKLSFCY